METTPQPTSLDVRPDIAEGHARAWRHIASPGSWWSGAERVAIAHATRTAWDCPLCTERKQALSPNHVDGYHARAERDEILDERVVDVVHRLVTDQARLSREWFDALVEEGTLTRAQHAELVGVVTLTVSMDVLRIALGQPLDTIPDPEPGEPSRYEPPGLAMEDAWVPMIRTENLGPDEKDLYGPTGNVIRAMSSVPNEVRALKALASHQYLSIEQMADYVGGERVGRAIDRAQMELVAGRVSALHECFY